MSELVDLTTLDLADLPYGDPPNEPFWGGAREKRLLVQRCNGCGNHQHYARPFCLSCRGTDVGWAEVSGAATIYSKVTVRMQIVPDLEPPYVCAIVELDEGPRFLTHIIDGDIDAGTPAIGDRVELAWRDRDDQPPIPVWRPAGG